MSQSDEKKEEKKKDDKYTGSWRLQISSEHKLRSENLAFDIDVWYPILKQFTFPTVFLPLKRREAIAIIHYYETRYIKNSAESIPTLTLYDIKILNNLETEIDKILTNNEHQFKTKGAFMRLCGRSPKDSEPLNRDIIRSKYNKNLNQLINDDKLPNNANTKLIAIANTSWLKISNKKDVMSQLLSSERVYTDLHDWIRYGEPEQIVFRVWEDELSLDYEFRAFVYNNKITAISQYDHYAIYPYLSDMKDTIKTLIIEKWKEVHEFILQNQYCIDFGYIKPRNEIILIEISPFRKCTGPACFSWITDHNILYGLNRNNDNEIEFRLNNKSHPQIEDLVEANWELRWWTKDDPQPYWYLYNKIDENWEINMHQINIKKRSKNIHYGIMSLIFTILIIVIAIVWYFNTLWGIILTVIAAICAIFDIAYLCIIGDDDDDDNDDTANKDEDKIPLKGHLAPIKQVDETINNEIYTLFVYGTLKRNFHWNHKYLSRGSKFVSKAKTVNKYPLIMGECNVPYVLDIDADDIGYNILGEVWEIDYETLIGLDEYEGIHKGHYKRNEIDVILNNDQNKIIKGHIYMKANTDNVDLSNKKLLNEYSYEYHKKYYSPIKHIQVKQLAYLGEDFSRT